MSKSKLHQELAGLSADLAQSEPAPVAQAAPAPQEDGKGAAFAEMERLLTELGDTFVQRGEEAQDLIADHPWAALGAAFLLGLAAGRLMSRG